LITVTKTIKKPPPPDPPLELLLAIAIFKKQQRELFLELSGHAPETERILEERWRILPSSKKERYNIIANESRKQYKRKYEEYEVEYSLWEEECTKLQAAVPTKEKEVGLFSKVVRLREDSLEGKNYTYWYVIPFDIV